MRIAPFEIRNKWKDLKIFSIGESKRKDGMMEKESNFFGKHGKCEYGCF